MTFTDLCLFLGTLIAFAAPVLEVIKARQR